MTPRVGVRIQRAAERSHWYGDGVETRQSFPALGNFDLTANAHGMLLVNNDDLVEPGTGFGMHQHRDAEIITWVVAGEIHHRDSTGAIGTIRAGQVQAMSAGTGITHSEENPRRTGVTARVVQMWLPPDQLGAFPHYATVDAESALVDGELTAIATGIPGTDAPLRIGNSSGTLHAARLRPGDHVRLPSAPFGHLYIITGEIAAGQDVLTEGDSMRLTATDALDIHASTPTRILYWEMLARARDVLPI